MLTSKKWWYAAAVRAMKTFCQTIIATIGAAALVTDIDWAVVGSAAALAFVLSMLTSLAGLPEVEAKP